MLHIAVGEIGWITVTYYYSSLAKKQNWTFIGLFLTSFDSKVKDTLLFLATLRSLSQHHQNAHHLDLNLVVLEYYSGVSINFSTYVPCPLILGYRPYPTLPLIDL